MLIVWNQVMNAGFGLPPFVDLQKGMEEGTGESSVAEKRDSKELVPSIINSL